MHRMLALMATVEFGPYLAWWKIVPPLLMLFAFGRLLTWIDKDTPVARLPREWVNLGMLAGLILAYALFLLLPSFWIAFPVLLLLFFADAGIYILLRQRSVGLADLSDQFSAWKASWNKSEVPGLPGAAPRAVEGVVTLLDKDKQAAPIPEADDPARAGYDAVQALLHDPLLRGAERIELLPEQTGVATVRFYVDGMPYSAQPMDRAFATAAVAHLKFIARMDVNERRKPQHGMLFSHVADKQQELGLNTAGNAIGEFLQIIVDPRKQHALSLDELGMAPHQLAAIRRLISEPTGIVLVAAPRGQGLRTTLFGMVRGHDAYLTHIHAIERAADLEFEGVTQNKLAPNATADEESRLVNWVIGQQPDVLMMSRVDSPESANQLIDYAGKGHRVYIGMRAINTIDAMAQWRKLVGDDRRAVSALQLLVASRVLRRLCTACKIEYEPDPQVLRKLNLDPRRVTRLYQARTEPMRDSRGNPVHCEFCQELHYKGRFAIFELMSVDDAIKQVVLRGGGGNDLQAALRASKGILLQDAAVAAAVAGDTSLQEVKRVLTTGKADKLAATPE